MKTHLLWTLLALNSNLLSQNLLRLEHILNLPRIQTAKIDTVESSTVMYLSCPFSESNFLSETKASDLENLTVIKVYYVYTQYKQAATFDQRALDKKRLIWLGNHYPSLLHDPLIEWELVEQTGCSNAANGDAYFHGFMIVHRPASSAESQAEELKRIHAYIENPDTIFYESGLDPLEKLIHPLKSETTGVSTKNESNQAQFTEGEFALFKHFQTHLVNSETIAPQRIDKWVQVSFTVKADGTLDSLLFKENYPEAAKDQIQNAFSKMPPWTPAFENGKAISSIVNLEIRVSYSGEVKGMYSRDGIKPTFSDTAPEKVELREETGINLLVNPEPITVKSAAVYKGLDLVRSFQNTAVVMDVTGSMTTHIAALIHWLQTNHLTAAFTSYTFFNDGDSKSTKQKKIGETGGIYLTKNLDEVDGLIEDTMEKGNGGEAPENDLEAVIYAFQHDENANAVLLIADNYSEVRDLELLAHINRPVHVLLCAAPKFVRCDYLQIAKSTGGLFLINGEQVDLSGVQKGDVIQIQKVDYKYNGSEFEILHKGDIHY